MGDTPRKAGCRQSADSGHELHPAGSRELATVLEQASDSHSADVFPGQLFPQRQTVELIPLTEVHYWYRGKTNVYYVYGTDHRVYVADYPERYCCGCTII